MALAGIETRPATEEDAHAVSILAAGGQEVEIEFSPDTGLPLRQSFVTVAADGRRVERTETFADWREVDGVRFPFKAVQFENDVKMLEVNVSAYRVNTGVRPIELSAREQQRHSGEPPNCAMEPSARTLTLDAAAHR